MQDATSARVGSAISFYSRSVLAIYDSVVGFNCRFLWKCPFRRLLELYNEHVSANHLDIGVGTGYFMAHCRFPAENPRIALMDYSANSLAAAGKRLSRYKPEVYRRNALETFDLGTAPFDSVGMMNLLHCLPGDMKTKGVVFEHVREVMNPGAVLFGSTILYRGMKLSAAANRTLKNYNRRGIMTNLEDDADDLRESLERSFAESGVDVAGCMALFWARK